MINNHNSINGQTVILGDAHQHKVQALIYWARYKKRRGMAIFAADWTNVQIADAIGRVNSYVPSKVVELPGKLEKGFKWTFWDTKW